MKRTGMFLNAILLMALLPGAAVADDTRLFTWDQVVDSEDSSAIRKPTGVAAGSDTELAVVDAHDNRLIVFRFSGTEWTLQQTVKLPAVLLSVAHDGTRIEVDEHLRSVSNPAVWVVGDALVHSAQLSPVATYEGQIVGRNIVEGPKHKPDYSVVPSGVFTVVAEARHADRRLRAAVQASRGDTIQLILGEK